MKQSLSDKIYLDLKKQILKLDYNVNEMLTEQSVAQKYNSSKTPAREALAQLCQDGYLVRYPSCGYFIKGLSVADLRNMSEVRQALEFRALKNICERASDEEIKELYSIINVSATNYEEYDEMNTNFHSRLGELSKNDYLKDSIVRTLNAMSRPSAFTKFNAEYKAADSWHKKIIDSLLARDYEAAIDALDNDLGKI